MSALEIPSPKAETTDFNRVYAKTLERCPDFDTLELVLLSSGLDNVLDSFDVQKKVGERYELRPIEHLVKDVVKRLVQMHSPESVSAFEKALAQLEEGKFTRRTPSKATSTSRSDKASYTTFRDVVLAAIPTEEIEAHLKQRKSQSV